VNELEETQVKRQFLSGNTSVWTQPTAQQRPESFHRVRMHFTKAVAIFISCVLTSAMIDALVGIAPSLKSGVNAILVCVNQSAWLNGVFDQRLDGLLLPIVQQMNHYLSTTLNHAKDWRFFSRHRASARLAFASASSTFSLRALDHLGLSLVACHHIGFITLDLIG
jgi:hypothetical protein